MFALSFLFCFQFTHILGSNSLLGFVFGFQRLCFCRCGVSRFPGSYRTGRSLGGDLATPYEFPWLATISTDSQTVGGSLISDRHVITAASSLYGVPISSITVVLGAHDRCGSSHGLNTSVESVIIHPGYSPTNMNIDLALVKLRHVISFSQFIAPICMPIFETEEYGHVAWTATWFHNSTSSTCTPRVSVLPMMSSEMCLKHSTDPKLVTQDKGCLGPLGVRSIICKSDAGSPVMRRWTPRGAFRLVGVISSASTCENQAAPLYTRVLDHASWINDHTRLDCQCF